MELSIRGGENEKNSFYHPRFRGFINDDNACDQWRTRGLLLPTVLWLSSRRLGMGRSGRGRFCCWSTCWKCVGSARAGICSTSASTASQGLLLLSTATSRTSICISVLEAVNRSLSFSSGESFNVRRALKLSLFLSLKFFNYLLTSQSLSIHVIAGGLSMRVRIPLLK